jgi:hypothetical protein
MTFLPIRVTDIANYAFALGSTRALACCARISSSSPALIAAMTTSVATIVRFLAAGSMIAALPCGVSTKPHIRLFDGKDQPTLNWRTRLEQRMFEAGGDSV